MRSGRSFRNSHINIPSVLVGKPGKKQNGLIATHIRNQAVFDSGRGFRRFVSHESETLVFAKSGKTPVQNRS